MIVTPTEILHVSSKKVSCDGNREVSATLGHPVIYLDMGENNSITCPYCSKFFTLEKPRKIPASNLFKKS